LQHTTFGFIPAGTGNGLVKSIQAESNEFGDIILTSAFIIAKGRKTLIDLTELDLEYF